MLVASYQSDVGTLLFQLHLLHLLFSLSCVDCHSPCSHTDHLLLFQCRLRVKYHSHFSPTACSQPRRGGETRREEMMMTKREVDRDIAMHVQSPTFSKCNANTKISLLCHQQVSDSFSWLTEWAFCDVGSYHGGRGVRELEINGSQLHINRILVLRKFVCERHLQDLQLMSLVATRMVNGVNGLVSIYW